MHETFWSLLHDAAHWEFELFLMLLFDGLIFGLCWPFLRKHWKHHKDRDDRTTTDIYGNQWTAVDWSGSIRFRPTPVFDICDDCGGCVEQISDLVSRCIGCGGIYAPRPKNPEKTMTPP